MFIFIYKLLLYKNNKSKINLNLQYLIYTFWVPLRTKLSCLVLMQLLTVVSSLPTVSLHTLPLRSGTVTWTAQSESPYPCLQWWSEDGLMKQTKLFRFFPNCMWVPGERFFVVGFLNWENIHLVALVFILYSRWKSLMGKWSQLGNKKYEEEAIDLKTLFAPLNLVSIWWS